MLGLPRSNCFSLFLLLLLLLLLIFSSFMVSSPLEAAALTSMPVLSRVSDCLGCLCLASSSTLLGLVDSEAHNILEAQLCGAGSRSTEADRKELFETAPPCIVVLPEGLWLLSADAAA